MLRRVLIDPHQKVTDGDFNNFGILVQESTDAIVTDFGVPDAAFTGFPVVGAVGDTSVTVGAGRLYMNGKMHFNNDEGGAEIDLVPYLPGVTRRWIAVIVWGQETDAQPQPRTFLQNATTRTTVGRVKATERRRHANIGAAGSNNEGPDPLKFTVASDQLIVAWILIDTGGIIRIERVTENVAPSTRSLETARRDFEAWRTRVGAQLDTLRSDLASLAERLRGTAPLNLVLDIARDLARAKETLGLPEDYTAWHADHFLTLDESDNTHVDWLARIEEGIRFPHAAEREAQIQLLNPIDDRVINHGNFILPKYNEVKRFEVVGKDGEISISSYNVQTINYVRKEISRTRIRWGTPFTVCTNSAFWRSGTFDQQSGTFRRGNETFQAVRVGNTSTYRLTRFWTDTVLEHYWDRVVTNVSVGGASVSQTWLNSQEGWLTRLTIPFTRKGAAGDVRLLVSESHKGEPDLTQVIGEATLAPAALRVDNVNTPFVFARPLLMEKGKRYTWTLITTGAHFIATVNNNKYGQGTSFYSTDGAWHQGSLTVDYPFALYFADFVSPNVTVQLENLQLTDGIAAIDINCDIGLPDGTQVTFQVQINGIWKDIQYYDTHPLIGLPNNLPFRVRFVGTTDLMPGIGIGPASRTLTWRPRSDFRHISDPILLPSGCKTVVVDLRLEAWRGAPYHTNVCKILTGATYATLGNAASIEDTVAWDDPGALIRRYTFVFATAITSFRLRIEGTTDNVVTTYHVAERVDVETTL